MIVEKSKDTAAGNVQMQNFSIEMNATMFNMLSKNVYTDIIAAPIRELSTNAIDACIAAEKTPKFDVHLPTMLEPHFSVRDYGQGLSEGDLLGLYSTFGASTKRESNDFNGVFGIGRMSCLAYATSFEVTSYLNGMKYSYLVTTDEGIPQMVKFGEALTTEPNGLCVSFNVKPSDTSTFSHKAKNIYKYFDVKPNTNTQLDLTIDKSLEGDGWYIDNSYSYSATLVMGNVAYTAAIDASAGEL
jgi:hypothetical protein